MPPVEAPPAPTPTPTPAPPTPSQAPTPSPTPSPSPTLTPTPTPAPDPAPAPGDIRKSVKNPSFWARLGLADESDEKPAAPAAPAPAATPAATPAPATSAPTTAKPKKPTKAQSQPLDENRAIRIATEAATKTAMEMIKPGAPGAPPAPAVKPELTVESLQQVSDELPDALQFDPEVALEMSRLHPNKYANLPQKLADLGQKFQQYVSNWHQQNPDKEFDIDDTDHDRFWEENVPDMPRRDMKEAERALIKRQTREEVQKELKPQFEEIERARIAQTVPSVVEANSKDMLGEILTGVNPEYSKMTEIKDLTALGDKDPEAAEAVATTFQIYQPLVDAAVNLFSGAQVFSSRNPAHVGVLEIATKLERIVSQMSQEDQMFDGRMFATREKYAAMNAAERSRHWVIDQDNVLHAIGKRAGLDAKKFYENEKSKFEKMAKARGIKLESKPAPAQPAVPTADDKAKEIKEESPSPSVGSKTTIRHDKPATAGGQKSWIDDFGFGLKPSA